MPAKYVQSNLKDIVEDNKAGKLVLPNFQRDFVWDFDKQKRLLSTFLCGLPIGSLLLLNGKKDDFSCRNLCYTSDPKHISTECSYLLDGQQRLSSLASFFSNLFGDVVDYNNNHDSLYNALRHRWYLRLEPQHREADIFGWHGLNYSENRIYNYEPNDLVDFIGAYKVYKNKKDQWWHPAYLPKDEKEKKLSPAKRKEAIAEAASRLGIIPLWEFYEAPDSGLHEMVLRKIGERRRHVIEAAIKEGEMSYFEILGHLDPEIEDRVKNGEEIEETWIELRTNWKKEIITCIKKSVSTQELPVILLPADEVGRAVATFSAVNEGGTRLDPYDLIVARAAKSRQEKSLTIRVVELLKNEVTGLKNVYGQNSGQAPKTWSSESFGALADNVPTSALKDIFLNALSIYNHCKLKKKEPKVEHIKIKGILELSHEEINDGIEPCILAIKQALAFLCFRCGMRSLSDLHYKLMIQPIIYCFLEKTVFSNTDKIDKIEYWYWLSLFSGRYREYQNETCVEDIENLLSFIKNGREQFKTDEEKLLNYEGYSSVDVLLMEAREDVPAAIYNGLMCYVLSRQPRDFLIDYRFNCWELDKEVEKVVDDVDFKLELHDHHIMPLATQKTLSGSTSEIRKDKTCILNSPLNRTYILGKTNNALGAKLLSEYMPTISKAGAYHHCIPAEDFSVKNPGEDNQDYYKRFLKARYDRLRAAIEEELSNLNS